MAPLEPAAPRPCVNPKLSRRVDQRLLASFAGIACSELQKHDPDLRRPRPQSAHYRARYDRPTLRSDLGWPRSLVASERAFCAPGARERASLLRFVADAVRVRCLVPLADGRSRKARVARLGCRS